MGEDEKLYKAEVLRDGRVVLRLYAPTQAEFSAMLDGLDARRLIAQPPPSLPPRSRALGKRLRRLRERRGWTAIELARRAGVTDDHIARIEKGHVRRPRASTLHQLASALLQDRQ